MINQTELVDRPHYRLPESPVLCGVGVDTRADPAKRTCWIRSPRRTRKASSVGRARYVSELSWKHIDHPSEVVEAGAEITRTRRGRSEGIATHRAGVDAAVQLGNTQALMRMTSQLGSHS